MPARRHAESNTLRRQFLSLIGPPRGPVNTGSSAARPAASAPSKSARNAGIGTVRAWCVFVGPAIISEPTSPTDFAIRTVLCSG